MLRQRKQDESQSKQRGGHLESEHERLKRLFKNVSYQLNSNERMDKQKLTMSAVSI